MCMWNQLFKNNEGWGRTLIILWKIARTIPSTPFIKNGFLRKTVLNLVETNAAYKNKYTFDTTRKAFPIQTGPFEILGLRGRKG